MKADPGFGYLSLAEVKRGSSVPTASQKNGRFAGLTASSYVSLSQYARHARKQKARHAAPKSKQGASTEAVENYYDKQDQAAYYRYRRTRKTTVYSRIMDAVWEYRNAAAEGRRGWNRRGRGLLLTCLQSLFGGLCDEAAILHETDHETRKWNRRKVPATKEKAAQCKTAAEDSGSHAQQWRRRRQSERRKEMTLHITRLNRYYIFLKDTLDKASNTTGADARAFEDYFLSVKNYAEILNLCGHDSDPQAIQQRRTAARDVSSAFNEFSRHCTPGQLKKHMRHIRKLGGRISRYLNADDAPR